MREILFRGKWTRNGKWIEGFYARVHDGKGNVSHRIYSGYAESDCGDFYPEIFEVDPSTVGQFTALCDKNGKKIFEGDIIKRVAQPMVVVWNKDGASFFAQHSIEELKLTNALFGSRRLEVIGNIHDNPELLEDVGR